MLKNAGSSRTNSKYNYSLYFFLLITRVWRKPESTKMHKIGWMKISESFRRQQKVESNRVAPRVNCPLPGLFGFFFNWQLQHKSPAKKNSFSFWRFITTAKDSYIPASTDLLNSRKTSADGIDSCRSTSSKFCGFLLIRVLPQLQKKNNTAPNISVPFFATDNWRLIFHGINSWHVRNIIFPSNGFLTRW